MPKVSIIIINWNGLEDTIECLESLNKIAYQNYEVIIVDNGSKGNDADILEERYKNYIKLIKNKDNLGFTEGNNIGIRKALEDPACKYILFLNNDTTIRPDSLSKIVEIAERGEYKHFGSFQSKIISYYNHKLIDSAGIDYSKNSLSFNRGSLELVENYSLDKEIFGCCFAAALCRRAAIEDLLKNDGTFFDKDFFIYAEDLDVDFRLQWRGWRSLYVADSIVYHKGSQSTKDEKALPIYYSRKNELSVMAKNIPISFLIKYSPFILVTRAMVIGVNFIKRGKVGLVVIKATIKGILSWHSMRKKGNTYRKDRSQWDRMNKLFVWKWIVKKNYANKS